MHLYLRSRPFWIVSVFLIAVSCSPASWAAEISLAWDPNSESDIAGYRLYYGTESGTYTDMIDVGNSLTTTVSGLTAGPTYYFVVTAYNSINLESPTSSELSSQTGSDDPPPAAPSPLGAIAGDSSVNLDWPDNTEPDLASYRVYRSFTSGGSYANIASDLSTSDFADIGLTNGNPCYYVVTAIDAGGSESLFSNEVVVTPADMTAPIVNLTTGSSMVNDDFMVDVNFSEAVSGLALGDFLIGNGSGSALHGSSATYVVTVSPAAPGTITVDLPAGAANDAAGNANLASNSLTVTYEDPAASPLPNYAVSEVTKKGNRSGSLTDLAESDDVYESLTEVSSGGNPKRRFSQLQHTWTFNISGDDPFLSIEAHHGISADGDDFILSYSVDGINFTDVITVTKTSDDDIAQTASLGKVAGTIYIRVTDSNHSTGSNTHFDTLFVDHLFVGFSGVGGANTAPTFDGDPVNEVPATEGQVYASSIADNASDADGDTLSFGKLSGPAWLVVGSDGSLSGTPGTEHLGVNTFSVEAADAIGGIGNTTLTIQVSSASGSLDVFVANITMGSASHRGNRYSATATVTVTDERGAAVPGATISATWSGALSRTDSAVIDMNGVAIFQSAHVKNGGTFNVTIDDIVAPGFTYNPGLDVESTDSITVP